MVILEGRKLRRSYGGFVAVDGVDLQVARGEIHGLIGPNGAGKSTIIDIMTGRGAGKTDGQVLLDGADVSRMSIRKRRHMGIARSFQRTNIFPELTVRRQLELAARNIGATEDDLIEILDELQLRALESCTATSLGYGDLRSLDLALAMIGRPPVLLLDEPASGLTATESLKLAAHLREIVQRWGITILMVEHDMEVIFGFCDRVTVLHLGRILKQGRPEEVRSDPTVVRAYLGSSA